MVGFRTISMRIIKIIVLSIGILGMVVFISYAICASIESDRLFLNQGYSGKIKNIRFVEGHRGYPDIYLNNSWHTIGGHESKIMHYIQINDSIVKKSGSGTIYIYRMTSDGKFHEKTFK